MAKREAYVPSAQRRFGAHMSIAGGLHTAFHRAVEVGCDCFQIFVKNQRQWNAPALTVEAVRFWESARSRTALGPVVAHATYLINLASPDRALWRLSINAYTDELRRCEHLGLIGLVVHPGSHHGRGYDWGIRRIADALNVIHDRTKGLQVKTVLETTAGQGTGIGSRFEHLAEIIARTEAPDRIAVCADTCHLFAAGYDLTTDAGYAETFQAFDRIINLDRLLCFHMNDSKKPPGSHVDRHDHIGKGRLGRSAFRRLVNDPRFFGRPMILETPKGTDTGGRDFDRVNLCLMRSLLREPPLDPAIEMQPGQSHPYVRMAP
ncbi:MAG: deoxyribonuclease IV [Phycisphaerae bacterium]